MSTNNVDVAYVANLARMELAPGEVDFFAETLGRILDYVGQLQQYDVEGVEPTFHAVPVFDRVREDVVKPGLSPEMALSNAPAQSQGQIKVPKVVESA